MPGESLLVRALGTTPMRRRKKPSKQSGNPALTNAGATVKAAWINFFAVLLAAGIGAAGVIAVALISTGRI